MLVLFERLSSKASLMLQIPSRPSISQALMKLNISIRPPTAADGRDFYLQFLATAAPAVDMRVPAAATDVAAVFTNFRLVNSIVLYV